MEVTTTTTTTHFCKYKILILGRTGGWMEGFGRNNQSTVSASHFGRNFLWSIKKPVKLWFALIDLRDLKKRDRTCSIHMTLILFYFITFLYKFALRHLLFVQFACMTIVCWNAKFYLHRRQIYVHTDIFKNEHTHTHERK